MKKWPFDPRNFTNIMILTTTTNGGSKKKTYKLINAGWLDVGITSRKTELEIPGCSGFEVLSIAFKT